MVESEHKLYALLVEDDELQAAMTAAVLTSAGFHATVTHDGTHAINTLTHKPQHLVIVDLYLPDIKGPDLIRALRAAPFGNMAKIVAVTASDDQEAMSEAFRAGADDIYQKSIGHDVLASKFESLAFKFRGEMVVSSRLNMLEANVAENTKLLKQLVARMDESAEAVTMIGEFMTTAKYANKIVGYAASIGGFIRNFWWLWALPAAVIAFFKTGVWTMPNQK